MVRKLFEEILSENQPYVTVQCKAVQKFLKRMTGKMKRHENTLTTRAAQPNSWRSDCDGTRDLWKRLVKDFHQWLSTVQSNWSSWPTRWLTSTPRYGGVKTLKSRRPNPCNWSMETLCQHQTGARPVRKESVARRSRKWNLLLPNSSRSISKQDETACQVGN